MPASAAVSASSVRVSAASTLGLACGMDAPATGQAVDMGSAVQPQVSSNPAAPAQLVGVWEQDRWTGIGARAIMTARSTDAGITWSVPEALGFSACAAIVGSGASFERTSDPWISFGHNGTVYASALAFSAGNYLSAGGRSAVLVARSDSGGAAWQAPVALIDDTGSSSGTGPFYFDDRDSVTADPHSDAVYVVWDRISSDATGSGPAWLGRTLDGNHWSSAILYDPGSGRQTFNNQIALLADGSLLDVFTLFSSQLSTSLQVVRSADQGATWSADPVKIADMVSVGTTNPLTQGSIRDSALQAQIAVDPSSGIVAAVWQQYWDQPSASVANDGIALSLSADGGKTWSPTPRQINGAISVAAFSPTVRFLSGGIIAVTYYDLRDYVPGSTVLSASVWLTESSDGGTHWNELRIAGPFDLNLAPLTDLNPQVTATALFLGDNQGLTTVDGTAIAFLAATDPTGAHIYALRPADTLSAPLAHKYQSNSNAVLQDASRIF